MVWKKGRSLSFGRQTDRLTSSKVTLSEIESIVQKKGFSITELLIVITVIGILTAIGVIAYGGITNKARDAAVQSDLEAVSGQLESYRVNPSNPTEYPRTTGVLATLEIKASKKSYQTTINANFIYCIAANYQSFALVAKSKSNNFFMITEDGFKSYTLSASDFTTSTLCPALGMSLVSAGMSAPDTWQTWVSGS